MRNAYTGQSDDLGPLFSRPAPVDNSIESQFRAFHKANPRVFAVLKRLSLAAVARGRRRLGIGALWEAMRWELSVQTDADDFKLNNNFRSRYARKLMDEVPELAGVFELRELRGK